MLLCSLHADIPSQPLYSGAPITAQASWLSIYRFNLAKKLTDAATKQLIDLVAIHCPKPNVCPKSLYILRSRMGCMETCNSSYCATCHSEDASKVFANLHPLKYATSHCSVLSHA